MNGACAPDPACALARAQGAHVITIDGPAGAGKSTIARMLAQRLGWFHLDSGATYRAVAAAAIRQGVAVDDERSLGALAERMHVEVRQEGRLQKILADGQDVTDLIRTPEVTRASSPVSAVPAVRLRLVAIQREIAEGRNTVAEGRDMGTVVFPDAVLKVYLDASPEERARRRLRDFQQAGKATTFDKVLQEMSERDTRDSTRETSPLRAAEDAYTVWTDDLSPDDIVDRIVAYYVDATL